MKRGYFFVNGEEVSVPTQQVVDGDLVTRENQELLVKMHVTLLIHKPAGYISSDIDEYGRPSYKNLLDNYPYAPMLHIAGRLDVDTTGLILASSDGDLVHHIISPKHHLPKTYLVTTRDPLTEAVCKKLATGVLLDDGYKTLPAQAKMIDSHHLELILIEGKYHQVKRMLIAVNNEVVALQRTAIGPWTLADLGENVYKELGKDEIAVAFSR